MYKKLSKPYSNYEVSETNIVRNSKKQLISKDKDGKTIRLTNDSGERKSIKVTELQSMIDHNQTEEKVAATKPEKVKVEKTPKVKKEKVAKVQKEKKVKEPKPKKEKIVFEPTEEMKAIVAGTGSKASKMAALITAGATIAQTANMLGTHYSYVYNKTNGYYDSTKKAS